MFVLSFYKLCGRPVADTARAARGICVGSVNFFGDGMDVLVGVSSAFDELVFT